MDALRFVFVPSPPRFGAPAARRRVRLVPDDVRHAVDRRFLSVALDAAQVVDATPAEGPTFDFDHPGLLARARGLAPAYLCVGGPTADRTFYALKSGRRTPPPGYAAVLTAARWDALVNFAQDAGFALMFTLNAGSANRARGVWHDEQARLLLRHAAARRDPVPVWALGHELNRRASGQQIPPAQLREDLALAGRAVAHSYEGAQLAGPGARLSPGLGEGPADHLEVFAAGGLPLDVITWHYSPLAAPSAGEPSTAGRALDPELLDDAGRWAERVEAARAAAGSKAPIWLAATSHATPAGEAGVSDRFEACLWWLDQLGLLARRGHAVVARDALAGPPGALIAPDTWAPQPDYWASVLWKQLMGREVLRPTVEDDDRRLRAYAHWTPPHPDLPAHAVTLLLVNLAPDPVDVEVFGFVSRETAVFQLEAPSLDSTTVRVNSEVANLDEGGAWPAMTGYLQPLDPERMQVRVGGHAVAFAVFAPTGATFST